MSTEPVHTTEILSPQQTALAQANSMEATIAAAIEAQMRAVVQARYALAIRNPRDLDTVRQKLLNECRRPGFAAVARYAKKQGKIQNDKGEWVDNYVVGPSIRFAEMAVRSFTNVLEEEIVIHDDDKRRVMRVGVTDLENNLTFSDDVVILKQVERQDARGRDILSARQNSYKKTVYTVVATEDELLQKQGALISKALRKQILRMVPGDLVAECMDQVIATQTAADKKDPDEQRKKVFDSFGALGISPTDLKDYLGHEIGLEDLAMLRAIHQTLRQGDAKWSEIVADKKAEEEGEAAAKGVTEKLREKAEALKAKEASKHGAPTDAPESQDFPPWAERETISAEFASVTERRHVDEVAKVAKKAHPDHVAEIEALRKKHLGRLTD